LFAAIQKMEQELPKKDFKIFFTILCSVLWRGEWLKQVVHIHIIL
jgi:hypothetical protein